MHAMALSRSTSGAGFSRRRLARDSDSGIACINLSGALRRLLAEVQRDSRASEYAQDDEDCGHAEGRSVLLATAKPTMPPVIRPTERSRVIGTRCTA